MAVNPSKTDEKQLDTLISQAVQKIGGKKENDICHYLPSETEGYIHHFTMRKMKGETPKQLADMIKKFIIDADKPKPLPPKRRAPRGTRKRQNQVLFSKVDIDRLLQMARLADDKEMIRKLTPRQDLRVIKRELISSIRHNRVDQDLWISYAELAQSPSTEAAHTLNGAAVKTH